MMMTMMMIAVFKYYGANNDRSVAKLEMFFVGAIIGRTISYVRAATWLYLALVCWNRLQATSLLSYCNTESSVLRII